MRSRPGGLRVAVAGGAICAIAVAVAGTIRPEPGGSGLGWLVAVYAVISGLMFFVRPSRNWRPCTIWQPASGDIALGAIAGGGVVALSWCVQHFGLLPGSPQRAWLFQLALATHSVGARDALGAVGLLLLLEEWVWRGWIQQLLGQCMPPKWVTPVAAGLYAAVYTPTILSLSDLNAGGNPLLVLAAFCLGGVLSALRSRTARLTAGLVAHGVFAYFGCRWLLPV